MEPRVRLDPERCDAAIFDMDGVITDTARVHALAWKATFDEFLKSRTEDGASETFDLEADYVRYVDGKPRYDGVASFLESRGIALDLGSPDDPAGRATVCGLGNRKNRLFLERLHIDGAVRFEDAVDLLDRLDRAGIRAAVISASRNAAEVLEAAGVADRFAARVDGVEAGRRGLRGKPAPDVFLAAAGDLHTGPSRAAVLEDAVAGVEAGRAGGFGWVIGVSRSGRDDLLFEAGADDVVHDLGEVGVGSARESG